MVIDPIVFLVLAATSLLLGVAFLILVFSYSSLLKKQFNTQKDLEETRTAMKQKALVLVEDAQKKSSAIIQEANRRAVEILEKATVDATFSQDELKKKLSQIQEDQAKSLVDHSNQFLADLHTTLENVQKDDIKTVQNVSSTVQQQALSQVEDFRHAIENETVQTEEKIAQEMEKQYALIQEELKQYKLEKMKKIDDSLYTILMFVGKEVLGKTLDIEDQQDLIKKVLEDAKKKGEFGNG